MGHSGISVVTSHTRNTLGNTAECDARRGPSEIRGGYGTTVENAAMAMVQRSESIAGPVAVGGRTITLVARTSVLRVGRGPLHALYAYAHPAHVEVLDEDGRREVVRVRDLERTLMVAILLASAGYVLGLRALRKGR
jgi:hypothetical protein